MDPNALKGNPLIFDKLNPELGGKVAKLVDDDMRRAAREAEEKARAEKKKKRAKRG